ncbi:hypothetical protein GCM10009549_19660 [Streptomyces thermoalcalitolerans]|uniref:Uncharacterized protein n=1 Tax=Streptomyces thermoalcalitolerans TaxID=65605 RepID=A0ABP3YYL5_9ACTN
MKDLADEGCAVSYPLGARGIQWCDEKPGQAGDPEKLARNHPSHRVNRLPPEPHGMQDPAMLTTDVSLLLPSAADLAPRTQQQPGRPRRHGPVLP